jgi:alkaline phosphatase D
VHANFVADLRARAGDRNSPILAAEFCGTSISSQGNTARVTELIRAANPDIAFADSTRRGYVVLDIRAEGIEASLRVVDSVKQPEMKLSTLRTFRVEAGRPGLQK